MKLIYILSIVAILSSCSDRVERGKLFGQYIFNDWSRDTIFMHSNGTYDHFGIKNGQRIKNSGEWKLNEMGNEVRFNNFSFGTGSQSKGLWISKIRTEGNEVHLMYAAEENYYYNKID